MAFLCGIVILQNAKTLPDVSVILILLLICGCLLLVIHRCKLLCTLLLGVLLGYIWCVLYAYYLSSWSLSPNLEGKNVIITGYVSSLPVNDEHRTSFLFAVKQLTYGKQTQTANGYVNLSWQKTNINLHAGDQWQFQVRLKKIHGTLNPGGFDYEAWAFQEHIRATGYVIAKERPILLSSHRYDFPLQRVRQYLRDQIAKTLPISNTSPWITALALGERDHISADNWQVLRNTGTNHLMAIAGLHIGIMSSLAFAIVAWLWRQCPAALLRLPAKHAGGIASLMMAVMYSMLAGFSIPTQRACIMLSVFLVTLLMKRHLMSWYAWALALQIVLLINPLSVLTESFWLSFASVALIIYGVSGRLAPSGLWWKLGRIQWVIAVGLIPFSIWLFQQCSLISFVANAIAIPWVGFVIVPITLMGCLCLLFSDALGGYLLLLADKLLAKCWIILTYFSHLSWATWYQAAPSYGVLLMSCVGIMLLLLPAGFPGRVLGIVWLLPLFFYPTKTLKPDEIKLTLLDVGQGLSAIVQTPHHLLVFDAGPKLSDRFDMGESVVLPYLRTVHAKKIDMLVISHGDNDHIGGAAAILNQMPVDSIKTSVPEAFKQHADYCLRNETWEWDHVTFSFLYPTVNLLGLNNDSSCVLRIQFGNQVILLTGDIEKIAETYLINNNPAELAADILIAPHHGSKTSSLDEFVRAVHPAIVLLPLGYRNRYHFPHPSVVKKYVSMNAMLYDTANAGAIEFRLSSDSDSMVDKQFYRLTHSRYWNYH